MLLIKHIGKQLCCELVEAPSHVIKKDKKIFMFTKQQKKGELFQHSMPSFTQY